MISKGNVEKGRRMFDGAGVALEYAAGHERVRLEAWGEDSIRVRASQTQILGELPGALATTCPAPSTGATSDGATLVNGKLRAQISSDGLISFSASDEDGELLSEQKAHFWWPGPRVFLANGNGHYRIEQRFKAYEGRSSTVSANISTVSSTKRDSLWTWSSETERFPFPSWFQTGVTGSFGIRRR